MRSSTRENGKEKQGEGTRGMEGESGDGHTCRKVPGQGGTGSLRFQAGGQGERQEEQGEGRWSQREGRAVSDPGPEGSLVRGGPGEMETKGCCPWCRLIMDKAGSREGEAGDRGA